jgi:hypothetical protein
VVFTWLRSRKPEYGTPTLALTLRVWSIALGVLAGVLIVGAAVSEIWLSLDTAGPWLFGIYGAAAALALLGALGFHLAYIAELPPPPPKPLKPKTQTRRRGRGKADETAVADDVEPADEPETAEVSEAAEVSEVDVPAEAKEADETVAADEVTDDADGNDDENNAEEDSEGSAAKLRNRRPAGKSSSRLFRRSRGGVALDD